MADFRSCLTIPNQTLTIVSRTQVVSDTTTLIPITYPGHNETVTSVTCVPTRGPIVAKRQSNETTTSSSLILIIPPARPAGPNCTTTTLFSVIFIPQSVITVPREIPITIIRNETSYSTLFTTTCSSPPISVPPISVPPISVPPISVPPISVPPISDPPISVPPVSVPPVSVPPISVPPISVPPISVPPISDPPVSVPPVSDPPVSVPPVSVPPVSVPPISDPPISVPPSVPISVPPSVPISDPPSVPSVPPSVIPSSLPPITPPPTPLSSSSPALVSPVSLVDLPASPTDPPTDPPTSLPSPPPQTLPASPSPSPPGEPDPPAPSTPPPPDLEPPPAPTTPSTVTAPPVPVPSPSTSRAVLPLIPSTSRFSSDPSGAVPPQLPDPSTSAVGQTNDVPVKVIVGSVVGGLAALAVLGFGIYYFFIKKSPVAPAAKYNTLRTDDEDQPRLQVPETDPHWGQYPEMQEYVGAQTGQEIQYMNNTAVQGQGSHHYMAVPSSEQQAVQYSDVPGNGDQYLSAPHDPTSGQGVLQHSDIPGNGPQTFGQDGGQNFAGSSVQAQGTQVIQGHDGTQALQYNQPHGQEQGYMQSHDAQGQIMDPSGQGQTDLHNFHDASFHDQGASTYTDVNAQSNPGYTDVNAQGNLGYTDASQGAPPYDAQVQGDPFTLDQSAMHNAPYAPDVNFPSVHPPGLEFAGSGTAPLIGVAAAGGAVIPAVGAVVGYAAGRSDSDERSNSGRPAGKRVLQKARR